ncbi:MAG: type VI secretion system baseplate subunit TssK [Gammaproteobacteria bacterium]|nr:type VI secretion system baseplate subunit TssK [Gammaproteobacteria bacterium]
MSTDNRDYLPEPLQWTEGMLLSPQHFQQNDIYWGQQLALHTRWTRPYGWGLWHLELDEGELQKGEIIVRRLEGLLPDGLAVQYPAARGDNSLQPLSIADHPRLANMDGRVRIHLAIAKRMRGAASDHSDLRRYQGVPGDTVLDENTGGNEMNIDRLRACLTLLPEDKLTGGHAHMPLLEIKRRGKGFVLSAYHPPLLRIGAGDFLDPENAILNRVRRQLRQVIERASGQAGDAEGRRMMGALTSAMPPLDVMAQSGEVHPFDLYLALAGLLGQVAQIASSPLYALNIAEYDHNELQRGFAEMLDIIDSQLQTVRVGHQTAAFRKVETGIFEIPLAHDWNLDDLYVELRGRDRASLEFWMRDAHVGDTRMHPQLSRRRLPGAGRQIARDDLSRRLPVSDNGVLFGLANAFQHDDEGTPQALIRADGTLRVSGPRDKTPDEIVLYYRQGGGAGTQGGGHAH